MLRVLRAIANLAPLATNENVLFQLQVANHELFSQAVRLSTSSPELLLQLPVSSNNHNIFGQQRNAHQHYNHGLLLHNK